MNNLITFGGNMVRQINFAMQQNYVPVFRNLTLTNNTNKELSEITVRISFEPEFAGKFESSEVNIAPGQTVEISPVNIIIVSDYLFSLTEKMVGSVTVEAIHKETVIASISHTIELLAYDQWTGSTLLPEMICAFVTPNHPKIQEIISKASMYMKKWCGDPSFTGYQSRSANAVKMQMGAVYAALQEENIAYITPPASYETSQRVRMPDSVVRKKFGTCLDLAVLYCSCLEYIDLNPILIFTKGHAFAGCWLEEETFSDCLQYDCSALTKRIAKGVDAISVVECTDFTAGKTVGFDAAESHGAAKLAYSEDFSYAVDIKRARASGIRPVPSRVSENGTFKAVDYGRRKKADITAAPEEIRSVGNIILNQYNEKITKQQIWERKLLDITLRNNLLNFRSGTSGVRVMTSDINRLEDEISGGKEFRLCPAPTDMLLETADNKLFERENNTEHIAAIADAEMKNHRLRTYMPASELERIMAKITRQAKVSLEENGANTLYLALGFLQWYENGSSGKPRYAPLVLVPINITRRIQDKTYSIKLRDDGIQVNITLIEMLRQTFGINIQGLNQLPEDENGVDLPFIFSVVRQAIMANSRWDIKEYAVIGQFSFSRFIMWNDIRNRSEELLKNKVTASLISGKTQWKSENITISPTELDHKIAPSDMAVPVAADSSQLAAVYASDMGNSFVLHGPPGTGKSQTITNIIANALYHNKTVLFVAEKMAALEVVEKRLNKIGLSPFCLELHSNKSRKRDVLKQLEDVLNTGKEKSSPEYSSEAEKIASLRCELNKTMEEIYKVRNYGMSLYDVVIKYEKYAEYGGIFNFPEELIRSMDKDSYATWRSKLERLSAAVKGFGNISKTQLKCCKLTECTPDTRNDIREKLIEFRQSLKNIENDVKLLSDFSGRKNISYKQYISETNLLKIAVGNGDIILPIVIGAQWERIKETVYEFIQNGKEQKILKNELLKIFEISVLNYDSRTALANWKSAQSSWFVSKYFKSKELLKELSSHAKELDIITKQNFAEYCGKLTKLRSLTDEIKNISSDIENIFNSSGILNGEKTNWDILQNAVDISETLRIQLSKAPFSADEKNKLAGQLIKYYGNASRKSEFLWVTEKLLENQDKFEKTISELSQNFKISIDRLSSLKWQSDASIQADKIISDLPMLKEWSGIMSICSQLENLGLNDIADKVLDGNVSPDDLLHAYDSDICRALAALTISETPPLTGFQGTLFEDTIRKYKEELERFRSLTIRELVSKLSAKIPQAGDGEHELAILQKAIKNGGRGVSIRRLFESIPSLLRRLCPVMLMSPISVAQYIDPSYPKFDYVIFDEASQLPTCEAVGAISRGENVIISGDPKQLPPTNFFSSSYIDEENYEKEDLESLLDDCLALSMPEVHLLWHYRSRHESLIAYSNTKYYDNKLYTFPSPDNRTSRVSRIAVDGFYDRSNSRTNKAEAEAVVNEIIHRLRDPELRKESIGVVTFSMPQQNLIEDILSEAYRKEPELEKFADEQYEPIIIKNLENVQGDERDVIMFSIGYGPDKEGKVSMNFGPLNRDGGWRRLNVAISRARQRMLVFSVITSDMIDLSCTVSDGVEGLKGFLKFAEQGEKSLTFRSNPDNASEGFEKIVADTLEAEGYSVDRSIGCSDFKIDIAVVDPDDPDKYILGIFCGTKSNYLNGTAEERYISQPSVLNGLGWNTINIYILDWFDNKEKVLSVIRSRIDELKKRNKGEKIE